MHPVKKGEITDPLACLQLCCQLLPLSACTARGLVDGNFPQCEYQKIHCGQLPQKAVALPAHLVEDKKLQLLEVKPQKEIRFAPFSSYCAMHPSNFWRCCQSSGCWSKSVTRYAGWSWSRRRQTSLCHLPVRSRRRLAHNWPFAPIFLWGEVTGRAEQQ